MEADVVHLLRLAPSPNRAEHPRSAFEVDPQVWLDLRRILAEPDVIAGLYHSHPDAGAVPSATDREMAWEPGWIWLVTAVRLGTAAETRAWRLEGDGGFSEAELRPLDHRGRPV